MKNLIKASLLVVPFLITFYSCSPDEEETQLIDPGSSSIEVLQKKLYAEGKLLVPDLRKSDIINFDSDQEYLEFLQIVDGENVNAFIDFTSQKVLEGEAKVDKDQEAMIKMMYDSGYLEGDKKVDWNETFSPMSKQSPEVRQ